MGALELVQGEWATDGGSALAAPGDALGERLGLDDDRRPQNHRALDGVAQLADVAGPVVGSQDLLGRRREMWQRAPHGAREEGQEAAGHDANRVAESGVEPRRYEVANGIRPDQLGTEGKDSFVQEDRYFDAYARYFRRYVEDYAREGILIGMVMPQNEFNSAQPFPSCCWTPEGLARFIPFLAREMGKVGVEIFFGTLERGNADLLDTVLADPRAAPLLKGVGVQWAGKGALEEIARRHPALPIWGSEQECGFGDNTWHYARYGWTTIRRYFNAGARAWHYWNLAMPLGGLSGWGWPQNALVSVDTRRGRFELTNDYWMLRHLAAFVKPGARLIPNSSFLGYENQLAFRNPDGELVIVVQNEDSTPQSVGLMVGKHQLTPRLPADSFNTIVVPAELFASND